MFVINTLGSFKCFFADNDYLHRTSHTDTQTGKNWQTAWALNQIAWLCLCMHVKRLTSSSVSHLLMSSVDWLSFSSSPCKRGRNATWRRRKEYDILFKGIEGGMSYIEKGSWIIQWNIHMKLQLVWNWHYLIKQLKLWPEHNIT